MEQKQVRFQWAIQLKKCNLKFVDLLNIYLV